MTDSHAHDHLLTFLHDEAVRDLDSASIGQCYTIPPQVYARITKLKQMQQKLAALQVSNASFRESVGQLALSWLRQRVLRRPQPHDEIRELNDQLAQEETQLRESVPLVEMSDSLFVKYLPYSNGYVRVPPAVLRQLTQRFIQLSVTPDTRLVLERFEAVRSILVEYPPDPRILGFAALAAAAHPDFDARTFFFWDERVLGMIYGKEATPTHPMTYDRFLIHAILYSLPHGSIPDRYIGFRIGWDLFQTEWAKHFQHQLRALATTARLLRNQEPFPSEEEAFRDFYSQKLERYRRFMRSVHHRATATDAQMGRGATIQGIEMDIGSVEAGGEGMTSVFEGVSVASGARLGIPDPVFAAGARLIGLPLAVDTFYHHFSEMLRTLDFLDDPTLVASILVDSPLYFTDRKDDSRSFENWEPGAFAKLVRERYSQAMKSRRAPALTPLHASLVALQPGPVEQALESLEQVHCQLGDVPDSATRLVSFLLMDAVLPMVQQRRFAYELWFAEGWA